MYDYTIIGAGPTGLTIAWILAKYGYKVLIIERESTVGGCHRVIRVNGLFTEHSPRMYVGNWHTLQLILQDMGYNFTDIFAYNFGSFNIISKIIKKLSPSEILSFIKEYTKFMVNNDHSKHTTLKEFMDTNNFSDKSKEIIDSLARLTDGAGMNKYTLYQFLQLPNQNFLYNYYQPKKPNDVGLFKLWLDALDSTGNVTLFLDSEVLNLNNTGNLINMIKIKKDNKIMDINCKTCIFAIPPKNIINILNQNKNIMNAFGKFDEYNSWAMNTSYLQFISATFHWETKLKVKPDWHIPDTDWLVAYIILSNYMDFEDDRSKTVISVCATKTDRISKFINKTPDECTEEELKNELFRQLKESLGDMDIIEPDFSILSPELYKKNNIWTSSDSAFIYTLDGHKTYKSELFENLYSVGTHNGNSEYNFTSMESAMSNAMNFINHIIPETKKAYHIERIITINDIIGITGIFLLIFGIYIYNI